jgi:hypothetical protein
MTTASAGTVSDAVQRARGGRTSTCKHKRCPLREQIEATETVLSLFFPLSSFLIHSAAHTRSLKSTLSIHPIATMKYTAALIIAAASALLARAAPLDERAPAPPKVSYYQYDDALGDGTFLYSGPGQPLNYELVNTVPTTRRSRTRA